MVRWCVFVCVCARSISLKTHTHTHQRRTVLKDGLNRLKMSKEEEVGGGDEGRVSEKICGNVGRGLS